MNIYNLIGITGRSRSTDSEEPITIESLNPTLWLEDEAQYMTFSSASIVERWDDVRGNGTYVDNTDTGLQPTHNGDGLGVRFINDKLVGNFQQLNRLTLFVVCQPASVSGQNMVCSNETPITSFYRTRHFADQLTTNWSDNVSGTLTMTQAADTNLKNDFNVYFHELDLGGQSHRINRAIQPVYQSGRTNRAEINFTPCVGGDSSGGSNNTIKAVILFEKSLTLDEADVVFDYLGTKYGITQEAIPANTFDGIASVGDSTCRGNGDTVNLPVEYQGTQTNVNIWDDASTAIETYITTGTGVNNVQPFNVNPYATFTDSLGKHYIDRVGGSVYQVKHGVGGATLGDSQAANYTLTDWDGLMNNFLGYMNLINWKLELNSNARLDIKALCIALGDNDAADLDDANDFTTNLTGFINRCKQCFPNNDFKIFLRRPINTNTGTYLSTVRTAINNFPNARVFDTDGFTTLDGLHLDETSDIALGENFADAI